MLKQHRELSMFVCRTIENNEEAGIRPSKTYQSFVAAAGGHRELNFIEKDVRNYITREDDQSIKLAFWADARRRVAFEYFGDVISFDTTYNTNRYNLVCGSFVEVNHHGNALKGFLTDQCTSIKRAIEACMPTRIHHWCIWQITKKIPSKLNGYKGHAEIEQELSQVVWNSHSKDSFDRTWNDFLLKYGLVDNNSLIQFVKQYDNCLGSREQTERKSDAADFHTVISCATKSSIEVQFQEVYTHQNKKVKRQHTHIKSSHDEPLLESRSKRFDELVFRLQNICEFASELEELTAILHRVYNNVMVEMEKLKAKRNGTCSLSHEDANLESLTSFKALQGFKQEDI
ncbi:hypothetical protein Ahy_A06g026030 [Arachis hypogaea]|uniref:Uncharacterized protein n=1 Tax=Arachis hypogaea TaxID=3818 RepID=A0A445CJ67_ARAHY|nr:hypothetical protein Ahy_A06g026030 [Arachis hypogaea]